MADITCKFCNDAGEIVIAPTTAGKPNVRRSQQAVRLWKASARIASWDARSTASGTYRTQNLTNSVCRPAPRECVWSPAFPKRPSKPVRRARPGLG